MGRNYFVFAAYHSDRYLGGMMKLYIADLHFGHNKVIQFDHRPFADCDEMDRILIQLWNNRVQPDDDVYVLGDFAYRNEKPEEWYLEQLKGKKHLVIGNHDQHLLNNSKALAYFETIDKMLHISDNGSQICACHFPIAEWNGFYKGHYHIYGHIHNKTEETYQFMKNRKNALNAGCMLHNYTPVSLKELIINNENFKNCH